MSHLPEPNDTTVCLSPISMELMEYVLYKPIKTGSDTPQIVLKSVVQAINNLVVSKITSGALYCFNRTLCEYCDKWPLLSYTTHVFSVG